MVHCYNWWGPHCHYQVGLLYLKIIQQHAILKVIMISLYLVKAEMDMYLEAVVNNSNTSHFTIDYDYD